MDVTIEQIMKFKFATQVIPESLSDGTTCYLALHPDLDGCMAHGDTQEEALSNLEEARRLLFEVLLEKNILFLMAVNNSQTMPYNLATMTGFSDFTCKIDIGGIEASTIPSQIDCSKTILQST